MKISRKIIETVLPIIFGTLIFVLYFILKDELQNDLNTESCEITKVSKVTYFIFGIATIILSSFYQILLGNRILSLKYNQYFLNLANCMLYSSFFVTLFIMNNLYNNRKIDLQFSLGFFLVFFVAGIIFFNIKINFKKIYI